MSGLGRVLIALLMFAVASPSVAADAVTVTPMQLRAVLQKAVDEGAPGLSAAIADGSGVIWTGEAGWADIPAGRRLDPDSQFGIGSITKTFVAVTVLQLVEEGRLKLTDTPAAILGRQAVRDIANADSATVADLLGHTAGVPSWEDDPRWIRNARGAALDPAHCWSKTEALDYIRGAPATSPAGTAFAYSNSGYTLLGLIIEKVTGQDAAAEIRRRLLAPLGLADSYLEGFEQNPSVRVPRRYQYATETFRATAGLAPTFTEVRPGLIDTGGANLSTEWVAGGMVSTARDLVHFARALRDGRLLKPQSLAAMRRWAPGFTNMEAGRGLFRIHAGDARLIGHTGGVLGFTAVFWWSESDDTIVAVLSNGSGMHAGKTPPRATTVGLNREFVGMAIQFTNQHREKISRIDE